MTCPYEKAFARQAHGVPRRSFDAMVEKLEKEQLPLHWKVRSTMPECVAQRTTLAIPLGE